MEDRNVIIEDFRPLGSPDDPSKAFTTLCGVFDGHLSAKAAEMAANNLHVYLEKGASSSLAFTLAANRKTSFMSLPCKHMKDRTEAWNAWSLRHFGLAMICTPRGG